MKKDYEEVIGTVIGALLVLFLSPLVTMWLWNMLVTSIFGLRSVSYWEMVGLVILADILFKNHTRK
jgi:positive regulator of sigma E activity